MKSLEEYIREQSNLASGYNALSDEEYGKKAEKKNNGGVIGGVGYTGEKIGLGFLSAIEGAVDYVVGGIQRLNGYDEKAFKTFNNDWVNYNDADDWYNPGKGMKVLGDVATGVGYSLPSMAVLAGVTLATAGAGTPAAVAAAASYGTTFLTAGLSSAGRSTTEAVRKSGQLTKKRSPTVRFPA